MSFTVVEISISINAPANKVWQVFTDPKYTRKMGGEYVSNWQAGGPIRWKGLDGKMYTRGKILQIEPGRLLQHNLFDMGDGNYNIAVSVITYELVEHNGVTTLRAREEFAKPLTSEQHADALAGWKAALNPIKELAEFVPSAPPKKRKIEYT